MTVILRLILVLLLALTGSPAPAAPACHRPTAAHDMAGHHQSPAKDEGATPHACIGCVPPSDWLRTRIDGPALARAMPPVARVATLAIGSGAPPALPPPRIA